MKNLFLTLFAFLFALHLYGQDKQKIIFDCDLGGDIDDAYALALVLASPEFEVLGIVLDQGNTPERARLACKMLYETGRTDIPVVVGRKTGDSFDPQFHWSKGFEVVKPIKQGAADFIIENLRKYPKEVILFTVGPVTNMQDIIEKDAEALKLAKDIYAMFGSFYMGYNGGPLISAEWNVVGDLEASKAFTTCGAKIHYAGLDVTTLVKLKENNRKMLLMRNSPLTNALSGLYPLWRTLPYAGDDPTLFDVVAVGMVLWPDLFKYRPAHVKVIDGGYTVIDESKEYNGMVGMSIETEIFLSRFMERMIQQNLSR